MVKLSDLNRGDIVEVDEHFTCMLAGQRMVHKNSEGLYLVCKNGYHYLDGQADGNGELVGIVRKLPEL